MRADAYEMKGGTTWEDSHGVRRGPRAALGLAGGGVPVDEGDRGGALVVAALLLTLGLAAGPLLAVGAPVLAPGGTR